MTLNKFLRPLALIAAAYCGCDGSPDCRNDSECAPEAGRYCIDGICQEREGEAEAEAEGEGEGENNGNGSHPNNNSDGGSPKVDECDNAATRNCPTPNCTFYDDFNDDSLDSCLWNITYSELGDRISLSDSNLNMSMASDIGWPQFNQIKTVFDVGCAGNYNLEFKWTLEDRTGMAKFFLTTDSDNFEFEIDEEGSSSREYIYFQSACFDTFVQEEMLIRVDSYNEWHTTRIERIGDRIYFFNNGESVVDYHDGLEYIEGGCDLEEDRLSMRLRARTYGDSVREELVKVDYILFECDD